MPSSHMDTTVTRLLVATRQLLEALKMWASSSLSDQEVSDIYVKLGNDFNLAVIAFSEYNIPMDDLLSVPDDLRACLESCLGLPPTQETLDVYLPQIREIIVLLLQGLKDKQTMYKRWVMRRTPADTDIPGSDAASVGRGEPVAQGDEIRSGQQGMPQSVRSRGQLQEERRPSSQMSVKGAGNSHRNGSPDLGSSTTSSPYLGTERIPPGRSGSTDGSRNRSPLSHPQQSFSPSDVISTHSLPPVPSSVDRPPSRTSPSIPVSALPLQDYSPAQAVPSGSISRAGLPPRTNVRANHPLPPPPPDAFRPPRSRPPGGGVSPSSSASALPFPAQAPNTPHGMPDRASSSSRSPGLSPSPLPQQAFAEDVKRVSPHKVTLTDDGPLPPNPSYITPPSRNNLGASTAGPDAAYLAGQRLQAQYEPMTPPPRGPRRQPEGLGSAMANNAIGGQMYQSRFSLDSDIDTPKSRRVGRDSGAASEHSRTGSSSSHNRRNSSFDAGSSIPTIVLPAPPTSSPVPPPSLPEQDPHTGLPSGENFAALATLTALQNSDPLGRRASKRYSSFHLKQMLPSHSKGPSSSALRYNNGEIPPMPSPVRPQRRVSAAVPPPMPAIPASPASSSGPPTPARSEARPSARTREPAPEASAAGARPSNDDLVAIQERDDAQACSRIVPSVSASLAPEEPDSPAPRSASSASGLLVFLQYGRETKKVSLDNQQMSSVADLQGVFMSRFDYSPDGMELFPDVYIKDPVTGIAYHLEEMEDIKPGALLSLNIDPLDQVKQHFDNTITSLSLEIKDLKNNMARNRRLSVLQPDASLAERLSPQMKSSERMPGPMRMATSPTSTPVPTFSPLPTTASESLTQKSTSAMKTELQSQHLEIISLRRDLGVMRQTYVDFVTSSKEAFQAIREQTQAVREVALSKLNGSRPLVNAGKAALEKQSSDTVEAVDDISDNIDTVKDDVVRRQILPRPGQLAGMREELTKAQKQVTDLKQQVTLLLPTCKQTWNQELKNVVDEQKLLQHQQKLATDLEGDISQAAEVFDTLEQYVAQRQLGIGAGKQLRTYQRPANEDGETTVPNLLMEIRTKEADPNKRLRAIEQQQKTREREKADKGDEFTNELSGFVTSRKLKKTGGTEEAERIRLKRQDKSFKKMFEGKPVPEGASATASPVPTTSQDEKLDPQSETLGVDADTVLKSPQDSL